MAVSLTTLRSRTRERADMVNVQFVTDAATSLDAFINEAYLELWDEVAAAYGDHFHSTATFTLTGGSEANAQYTLPADFYLLKLLERDHGTTIRHAIPAFVLGEKNGIYDRAYRVMGGVLQVEPYEYAAGSYKIYYVPGATELVNAGDTIDTRVERWSGYIVCAAAIKAVAKEESGTAVLERELERWRNRIHAMAKSRDAGQGGHVRDVYREGRVWPPRLRT